MNILICPNSFKECADSVTISEIINKKFIVNSDFNLIIKPLTDGGDGFLKVCENIFNLKPLTSLNIISYQNSLNKYKLLYSKENRKLFIESAELFGLKMFPENERKPLRLNSSALGLILKDLAALTNSQKILIESVWIGVGGTATIDFGIGACSHLGLKQLDENSELLEPIPQNFYKTKKLLFDFNKLPFNIYCIADVETELLGNPDAIEIYGPQKGAFPEEINKIKSGIRNILSLVKSDLNLSIPEKINGAGGGLAAGLNLFLGAKIISAKSFIKNELLKDVDFSRIDVVISGEGKFDLQSFEGKAAGVIVNICKQNSIPLFLINGSTELSEKAVIPENIRFINLADFYSSKQKAMQNYEEGIKRAAEIVLKQINK